MKQNRISATSQLNFWEEARDGIHTCKAVCGYSADLEQQRQERDFMACREPATSIISGLRGLPNLEEIIFSCTTCYQSPFCRSGPPTFTFPDGCDRGMCLDHNRSYYNSEIFKDSHNVLVQALSSSGRRIKKLTM